MEYCCWKALPPACPWTCLALNGPEAAARCLAADTFPFNEVRVSHKYFAMEPTPPKAVSDKSKIKIYIQCTN